MIGDHMILVIKYGVSLDPPGERTLTLTFKRLSNGDNETRQWREPNDNLDLVISRFKGLALGGSAFDERLLD